MIPIIKTANLGKKYNKNYALQNVDIELQPNRVYALIGPNGAGKSTFIKLLCGLILPSQGSIIIFGENYLSPEICKKIGYLSENSGYYSYMTALSYLIYIGNNYPDIKDINIEARELLKTLGLIEFANRKIGTFSKGMKQRLGLARILLHNPELLIFDEPLSGLDFHGKKVCLNVISELRKKGKTIIISSHELREIESICDEIIILQNGKLISHGKPIDLLMNLNDNKITLTYIIEDYQPIINNIANEISEIISFEYENPFLKIIVPFEKSVERKIMKWLIDNQIDFSMNIGNLDNIYQKFVNGNDISA